MLRDFIAWLDAYLEDQGSPAIARAVVGLMSFAVVLSVLLGTSTMIKTVALISTILVVTSLGLMLLTDRRSMRHDLDVNKRLVSHYCKLIDRMGPTYKIVDWDEVCVISPRGDTESLVKVRLTVLATNLHFIRLWFGCDWPQPPRYRRHVKLSVRSLLVDGQPGTSRQKTSSWIQDGKFDAIIHFNHAPQEGDQVSLEIKIKWKMQCAPLMRGTPDCFTMKFVQSTVHARYKIVLPEGFKAYRESIGFGENEDGYCISEAKGDLGRWVFTVDAVDPPVRHRFGLQLELKKRSALPPRAERLSKQSS